MSKRMRSMVKLVETVEYMVPVEHDDDLSEEAIEAAADKEFVRNVNRDAWFLRVTDRELTRQETEPVLTLVPPGED